MAAATRLVTAQLSKGRVCMSVPLSLGPAAFPDEDARQVLAGPDELDAARLEAGDQRGEASAAVHGDAHRRLVAVNRPHRHPRRFGKTRDRPAQCRARGAQLTAGGHPRVGS